MGGHGAFCSHTLTDAERDVPKAEWDIERVGMLCTTSATVARQLATAEKLCSLTWRCTYADRAAIEQLKRMVERTKGAPLGN